jgi:TatA/E family protein of Tat protein translocase
MRMFGTMGISELIIILVIVLIIFGAGRLPQIGEGVGKALKGFKKEVNEVPQPSVVQQEEGVQPQEIQAQPVAAPVVPPTAATSGASKPNIPYNRLDALQHGSPGAASWPNHSPVNYPPGGRWSGSSGHLDGRTGSGSGPDIPGTVPAASPRRPTETGCEAAFGDCK